MKSLVCAKVEYIQLQKEIITKVQLQSPNLDELENPQEALYPFSIGL